MKVAFDVDGVLTAFPDLMRRLMSQFNPAEVIVVTGRPESAREATLGQLAEKNIWGYSKAFFFPEDYTWKVTKGQVDPRQMKRLIEFKVGVCRDEAIEMMIEDDPRYIQPLLEVGVVTLLVGPSMKPDNFTE